MMNRRVGSLREIIAQVGNSSCSRGTQKSGQNKVALVLLIIMATMSVGAIHLKIERLKELKLMLELGCITEDEYDEKVKKLNFAT